MVDSYRMVNKKRISVVIPCKNEEKTITRTLRNVPSCVDEIIVVDNGSTDKTAEVARKAGAKVVFEPRKANGIGYGYAHMTGMANATGDYIFAADGDDTYPLSEIPRIIKVMEKSGLDFVSCSRYPLKNSKVVSKTRQLGVKILNLAVLILYGRIVNDILSGMWGVRKSAICLLDLREGGWDFSPEIKLAAMRHPKIEFTEYHIDHFERVGETSKQKIWKTGFNHLFYLLRKRFEALRFVNRTFVIPNLFRNLAVLDPESSSG